MYGERKSADKARLIDAERERATDRIIQDRSPECIAGTEYGRANH